MIPSARHIPWIHRHRCRETASHTVACPPTRAGATCTLPCHGRSSATARACPRSPGFPPTRPLRRLRVFPTHSLPRPSAPPVLFPPLAVRARPTLIPRIDAGLLSAAAATLSTSASASAAAPTLSLLRYCFNVFSSTHRSLSRLCTVYLYCRQLDRTDYHSTRARTALSLCASVSTIASPPHAFTFPSSAVPSTRTHFRLFR